MTRLTTDQVINKWEFELAQIYRRRSAVEHTFSGVLTEFAREFQAAAVTPKPAPEGEVVDLVAALKASVDAAKRGDLVGRLRAASWSTCASTGFTTDARRMFLRFVSTTFMPESDCQYAANFPEARFLWWLAEDGAE